MVFNKRVLIGIGVGAVIVVIIVATTLAIALKSDAPSVQTKSGKVKGKTSKTADGSTIYEFFNIPYATPPIESNRFQAPKLRNAVNPWDGTVDASVEKPILCVQHGSGVGTEDCLVMTIRTEDMSASKPVIVWIHGGGLMNGYCCSTGYTFDSGMTKELDAVTVNINYRLGLLGFSSIEELWDEEAGVYANNGIRDQIAALEWIQENIAGFGGDPNAVTIIGESGGATSVLALVSSSLANDKYHRAIALSPAPEMRLNYTKGGEFQQRVYDINKSVGCTQATKAGRKACLLEVPADYFSTKGPGLPGKLPALVDAYFDFPLRYGADSEYPGMIMTDPTVVQQSPRNLINAASSPTSKVKVIVSNTAQENGIVHCLSPTNKTNVFTDNDMLNTSLTTWYTNVTEDPDILKKTYEMYPNMSPQMIWDTFTTDMRSTCPTNDVAQAMSESSHHDIYRLYITNAPGDLPSFHAWDTIALFGFKVEGWPAVSDEESLQFREKLIGILKGFAKDGSLPDGWDKFPDKTMTLTNDIEDMEAISSEKPQQDTCEKLRRLDLVKYGWQN